MTGNETLDLVTAGFHLGAAVFTLYNCWVLWRDEEVKGISKASVCFMVIWGLWNLYYFQALEQPFTLMMNMVIVGANIIWLILAFRYRR